MTSTDETLPQSGRVKQERDEVIEFLNTTAGRADLSTAISYAAYLRVLLQDEQREAAILLQALRKSISNADRMKALCEQIIADLDGRKNNVLEEKSAFEKLKTAIMTTQATIVPFAEKGAVWTDSQRRNGFRRYEEEHAKHGQWLKWQDEEIQQNPRFSQFSASEQARKLKRKHSIAEAAPTIAKRLTPTK